MRRLLAVAFGIVALAGAAGQAQEDDLSSPKLRIEWQEFKELYDRRKIVVVDVRGEDAFRASHIPRARSIPLEEVERRAPELKKLKQPIVLYCA